MGFDTSEWVSRTAHEEGRETNRSLTRRSGTHQTVFQNSYPPRILRGQLSCTRATGTKHTAHEGDEASEQETRRPKRRSLPPAALATAT